MVTYASQFADVYRNGKTESEKKDAEDRLGDHRQHTADEGDELTVGVDDRDGGTQGLSVEFGLCHGEHPLRVQM